MTCFPRGLGLKADSRAWNLSLNTRASRCRLGALDGYRAYIGLLADLIYHLQFVCPGKRRLTDLPGIVLIDDVDLRLHPSWQRAVVETLAGAFPRLQFVLTSHSPIIAGTLHSQNVVIVRSEGGASTVETSTHRLHGLNADQIAISPYFGLPTTRGGRGGETEDDFRANHEARRCRDRNQVPQRAGRNDPRDRVTPPDPTTMIRYPITEQQLRDRIEAAVPGWLARAAERTARFIEEKCYDEKSNIWSEVKSVYMKIQFNKCIYCERQLASPDHGVRSSTIWSIFVRRMACWYGRPPRWKPCGRSPSTSRWVMPIPSATTGWRITC